MKLEKEQHVICYLQNNMAVEGTIDSYSDEEIILTAINGQSKLIIPHPARDIVFVKVVLESLQNKKLSEIKEQISTELQQTLQEPDEDLRNKSIKHLKVLANEQERRIIAERTKNHQLGAPRIVEYTVPLTNIKQPENQNGPPRFYKK